MANEIRLRDGLLWLNGRTHTPYSSSDNWRNEAKYLVGNPATPSGSSVFTDVGVGGDSYWAFTASASRGLSVAHNAALDFSLSGSGKSVYVRARFSNLSDSTAVLACKKYSANGSSTAGWSITRAGATESVNAYVSDGTTQQSLSGGTITYSTPFVAALTWRGSADRSTLYIDGVQVDQDTTNLSADPAAGASIPLTIGRNGGADNLLLYGRVFSVAMFDTEHTAAQVAQISTDLATPPAELTVGRTVFRDTITETSLSWEGDRINFATDIYPGSKYEAEVMRQQIQALKPGDVVPVTWTEDPKVNGFYEVRSVPRVTPVEVYLSVWRLTAEFSLSRVTGGFAQPQVEVNVLAAPRTGAVAPTSSSRGTFAIPYTALDRSGSASWLWSRGNKSENLLHVGQDFTAVATAKALTDTYTIRPESFYDGGCKIERLGLDGNWYTVVGDQFEQGLEAVRSTDTSRLRISTGAFATTFTSSGAAIQPYLLAANGWVGSASMVPISTSIAAYQWRTLIVERNTPEVVSITMTMTESTVTAASFVAESITFTARRGMHYIDAVWTSPASTAQKIKIADLLAGYTAVGSEGMHRTSNDVSGNRMLLCSHEYTTRSVTADNAYLEKAAATSFNFGFGIERAGSAAATHDTAASVIGEWWVAMSQHERVISP